MKAICWSLVVKRFFSSIANHIKNSQSWNVRVLSTKIKNANPKFIFLRVSRFWLPPSQSYVSARYSKYGFRTAESALALFSHHISYAQLRDGRTIKRSDKSIPQSRCSQHRDESTRLTWSKNISQRISGIYCPRIFLEGLMTLASIIACRQSIE